MVDFKVDIPGNLIVVDHSLFRAFNKGAIGMIKVNGKADPRIYTGKTVDAIYLPEGQAIQPISMEQKVDAAPTNFEERMKAIFFAAFIAGERNEHIAPDELRQKRGTSRVGKQTTARFGFDAIKQGETRQ